MGVSGPSLSPGEASSVSRVLQTDGRRYVSLYGLPCLLQRHKIGTIIVLFSLNLASILEGGLISGLVGEGGSMDRLVEMMGPCIHVKIRAEKVDLYFEHLEDPLTIDADPRFIQAMAAPYSSRLHRLCHEQNPLFFQRLSGARPKSTHS